MNIICLDAEFADNEELLELSMFNAAGEEVYHSYYRPEKITNWRTDIHHITPEMVKNERTFADCRKEVGEMLASAFAVTGFAVDNDLRVLAHSYVEGMDEIRVIDVKDMFWYLRGRAEGMSPFAVPSLLVCANALGLEFAEEEAHSASADTEATLKCFRLLCDEFAGMEQCGEEEIIDRFAQHIMEAKAEFVKEQSRGYVKVYSMGPLHKLKFGHQPDVDRRNLLMEVEVADRYKAEYELRKLLKKKEVPDKFSVYKLTAKLLQEIGSYRNEYDAEESAWCKKIVRNLSRLTL